MNTKLCIRYAGLLLVLLFHFGCDAPKNAENSFTNNRSNNGDKEQKDVTNILEWNWQLEMGLSHNYFYGETEDLLLIYSHDGGISGDHFKEGLYAVDKDTGELKWHIEAGYLGFDFALTENQEQATVFSRDQKSYLRHINVLDGSIQWAQYHSDPKDIKDADSMVSINKSIITFNRILSNNDAGKMTSYDTESGKVKWSKSITGPSSVLLNEPTDPYILLIKANRLIALDPDTGEEIWMTMLSGQSDGNPRLVIIDHNKEPFNERWLFIDGEGLFIDLETGTIKHRYTSQQDDFAIISVDEQHWLVHEDYTKLYDTVEQQELWSVPGSVTEPTRDGDILFAMIDGVPSALNWSDGSLLWKMDIEGRQGEVELTYAGNFYVLDDRLVALPFGKELLIFEKISGDIVYRMDDMAFDYPISLASYSRDGLIFESDGQLYIGSSTGVFSSISLETFLNYIYIKLGELEK